VLEAPSDAGARGKGFVDVKGDDIDSDSSEGGEARGDKDSDEDEEEVFISGVCVTACPSGA